MNVPNRYLAAGALVLASLALIVKNPKESDRVSVDVRELARVIENEEDHVTSDELASMLMEGNHRLLILDLRDSASYSQYHIPTADRRGIAQVVSERLSPSDTVILYSDGGIHAAQVWMILVARGYRNAYTLRGGLNEWKDRILFPHVGLAMSSEEKKKLSARAKFFGGEILDGMAPANKSPGMKLPAKPQKKFQKELEKAREVC